MSSQGQTDWVLLHLVLSTLSPHPPPIKGRGLSAQGSCQGRGGRRAQKCVAEKAGLSKCLREVRLVAPLTHIHTPHAIPSSWAQLQCKCGCISRAWESQLCNEHFIFIKPSLPPPSVTLVNSPPHLKCLVYLHLLRLPPKYLKKKKKPKKTVEPDD